MDPNTHDATSRHDVDDVNPQTNSADLIELEGARKTIVSMQAEIQALEQNCNILRASCSAKALENERLAADNIEVSKSFDRLAALLSLVMCSYLAS